MCLALGGLALLPLLPVKLAPSHSLPSISVRFYMDGSSSRVVEMEATSKLEAMLSRVSGVKEITSRSGNGWGRIRLGLDKHTPIDIARFEASTIIRQTWPQLPENVSYPSLSVRKPDEKSERPFLNYTLNAATLPISIQHYAEDVIKPKLSEIQGIYKIDISGATPMEWQLTYDAKQLQKLGISSRTISSAIQLHYRREFLGMGKSTSTKGNDEWIRVVLAPTSSKDTLNTADISVKTASGEIIALNKLVKVARVEQQPRSYFRINGLNSIYLSLTAEESVNQLELSKKIKTVMAQVEQNLPEGYELHESYDATEYIRNELDKIYFRSGLTILILLIFVFIITRKLKYLFLIVASLTVNLAIAAILYYFFKLEIQLYSLAGITISLSLIIDNTIIMADHLMHQNNRKVFLPTLAATLTTVGALSVIFFLDEKLRLNLQDFAAVVMINLMVSLFIALFFVPALMEKIGLKGKGKSKKLRRKQAFIIGKISRVYNRVILFLSRRKWVTYVIFIFLFGTPIFMLPDKMEKERKGAEFYNKVFGSSFYKETLRPITDKVFGGTLRLFVEKVYDGGYFSSRDSETVLTITASMPNGTTLSQMNSLMQKMESYLTTFSEIRQFQTRISSPKRASLSVYFTKAAEETGFPYQLKSSVISKALELGGGSWRVYGLKDNNYFNNDVRESAGNMKIKMLGYNYDELKSWADSLRKNLLKYRRIQDVLINSEFSWYREDYKEFAFNLNKQHLAKSGISPMQLFRSLGDIFTKDRHVESIVVNRHLEAIKLHSKQSGEYDIWALQHYMQQIGDKSYKINDLATIAKEQTPQQIIKENQQYKLAVQFNYVGSGKQADRVLKREIKKINKQLPVGYTAEEEGYSYWWRNAKKKQYWLLALLISIIFFTTSILFNSLRQPFAVILTIPVAFIGVFLTFYLFDLNFDQGGFASFILLSGITVNAGIYILNEYNNLRKQLQYRSQISLYLKAWNRKIIPILLTIISTILGFIPFMVGLDKESFWFPLAAGTIGGLIFSLVGLFVLFPLLVIKKERS